MTIHYEGTLDFVKRRLGYQALSKYYDQVELIMEEKQSAEKERILQVTKLIKPVLKFENKWVHIHYAFNQKLHLTYQELGMEETMKGLLGSPSYASDIPNIDGRQLSNYQYTNLVNSISLKYKKYLGRNLNRQQIVSAFYLRVLANESFGKRHLNKAHYRPAMHKIAVSPKINYLEEDPLKLYSHITKAEQTHSRYETMSVTTDIESKNVIRRMKQSIDATQTNREYEKMSKAKEDYERALINKTVLSELTNQIYNRLEKKLRLEHLKRGR